MAKIKYPDPKFFRMKDHIDWKAQLENLKEVGGIVGGMLKETDWKGVAKAMGNEWKAFGKRAKMEAGLFAKMTNERIIRNTTVGMPWMKPPNAFIALFASGLP